jgi:hypothetical protein
MKFFTEHEAFYRQALRKGYFNIPIERVILSVFENFGLFVHTPIDQAEVLPFARLLTSSSEEKTPFSRFRGKRVEVPSFLTRIS